MIRVLRNAVVVCLIVAVSTAMAQQRQHRVDARNMYERCLAIVPWSGSGSKADPKRAMYTPTPAQAQAQLSASATSGSRSGILAFQCIPSDDGKLALCEYVATSRSAFTQIMADPSVKSFLKGRDKVEDIIAEFTKHKKDFDINQLGVRVP